MPEAPKTVDAPLPCQHDGATPASPNAAVPDLSLTPEEIMRLSDSLDPSILELLAQC